MIGLWALLACAPDPEAVPAAPTVLWLSPADGETLQAGEAAGSVIVEAFTMQPPTKHNVGQPIGYLRITVDGAEALRTGETTFTLSLGPGPHTLGAALAYADDDVVYANADGLCDTADPACAPVEARIDVTVAAAR